MKKLIVGVGLFALAGSAFAAKDCEELKSEIDAKLKAKGVSAYTLEIVDKGSVTDKQVVGSCEAGAKEIVYTRG
jgi:predicted lipoprotein with Yx(FWY)xxD motif